MDVILAGAGLAVSAPLLGLCAVWIKSVDRGPALYRQWRVGRGGWLFPLYKLRTMRRDAERHGARFAQAGDQRILPGCAWMRRSHVDELPQLLNVLWGQMSLVGPRPERPEMLEQFRPAIPRIDQRHQVRPGLTGLAQLRHGYTNDLQGARRKLAYDLRYLRRRSAWNDLKMILATITRFWDPAAL